MMRATVVEDGTSADVLGGGGIVGGVANHHHPSRVLAGRQQSEVPFEVLRFQVSRASLSEAVDPVEISLDSELLDQWDQVGVRKH